jgi:hypothetical protein
MAPAPHVLVGMADLCEIHWAPHPRRVSQAQDGYIEGPNGEFVPPPWSAEVGQVWSEHNLSHAGHLIYGRVNFQFNKGHWTSQVAAGQRPRLGRDMLLGASRKGSQPVANTL